MLIEFDKDYLRELFEQGRTSDKRHRFQPEIIKGYKYRLEFTVREVLDEQIITVCRLLEISNHYK